MKPINIETARTLLEVVDVGLVCGVGEPIPGQMCVEAAVCYALGLPHGDDPKCVAPSVRNFKIRLNDARWSSNQARAAGLRGLAVAQLGSNTIDSVEFAKRIAEKTIRFLLPVYVRKQYPGQFENLLEHCVSAGDAQAARNLRQALRSSAAYAVAAAAYAADAATYAAASAASAASAAADAAYAADAANAAAANAVAATADAATYAADAADADYWLSFSANLALDVLREMDAPGIKLWDELNRSVPK